ncbi:MAG: site-2 protease family protein [Saprospiraceae bacterium]|nr:site-2 protease family protein [Saprospiraceae bacterium]
MLGLSYHILRVAKIPIKVHWTFGFFFLWIAYIGNKSGMTTIGIARLCLFALVLFFCVVLHELGHALTARKYGVQTKDIIISPIGGVARLMQMPDKPKQELIIAIAGPAVNFIIAVVLGAILVTFTRQGLMPIGDPQRVFDYGPNFFPTLFLLNAALIVFNLIPAFPMDGGRIFRALLAMKLGRKTATRWASILGQSIAVLFFIGGIYRGDVILSLIGVFVFISAAGEYQMVLVDDLLQTQSVDDVLRSNFTAISIDEPISHAIDLYNQGQEKDFIVIDQWGNIQGVLHQEFIEEAKKKNDGESQVREYLSPSYEPISSTWRLSEVFRLFQQKGYSIIPVYSTEKMIGVVDRETLNQYLRRNSSMWRNWNFK